MSQIKSQVSALDELTEVDCEVSEEEFDDDHESFTALDELAEVNCEVSEEEEVDNDHDSFSTSKESDYSSNGNDNLTSTSSFSALSSFWPWTTKQQAPCPATGRGPVTSDCSYCS